MITLTVNGAEGILTAKERINSMVEAGITNMCLAIEAGAKERCPVRDGTLRRSITTEVAVEADQIEGKVGTNLDYAPYIHEGTGIYSRTGAGRKDVPWVYRDAAGNFYTTSGIHPHPFLEEAAMDVSTRITEFFGEV
jgi:hypothetical protein